MAKHRRCVGIVSPQPMRCTKAKLKNKCLTEVRQPTYCLCNVSGSCFKNLNKMTGKEAIKKAIELVEKEKMMRYDSRKGKTDRQRYAIDAVVSTLVNVQIMLQNLDKQVVE